LCDHAGSLDAEIRSGRKTGNNKPAIIVIRSCRLIFPPLSTSHRSGKKSVLKLTGETHKFALNYRGVRDVRFTPQRALLQCTSARPLRAKSGLCTAPNDRLFDHLVGAAEH